MYQYTFKMQDEQRSQAYEVGHDPYATSKKFTALPFYSQFVTQEQIIRSYAIRFDKETDYDTKNTLFNALEIQQEKRDEVDHKPYLVKWNTGTKEIEVDFISKFDMKGLNPAPQAAPQILSYTTTPSFTEIDDARDELDNAQVFHDFTNYSNGGTEECKGELEEPSLVAAITQGIEDATHENEFYSQEFDSFNPESWYTRAY